MTLAIQDTLLQLFEHVRQDPETLPTVPVEDWQEGSVEWHLLASFRSMMEQVQQRTLEFKQTEQQLREREEQYRSVFEATGDGLFVIDLDGFVVEANPAACRQLGYTYEEIIGLHRSAIVHPDYRSLVPEYLQVIQMGDQFQGRAVDVRKDGTTFPVEVRGRAFTYKGRPHTLSVVRDVTKQVQAEEQLREKEEQYRSIFEATIDGLSINNLEDGRVIEANPALCRMFGYTYEEFIDLSPTATIHPDTYHVVAEVLQRVQAGSQFQTRFVALRKDGTAFHAEGRGTPFIYNGKPHLLGATRDITEQVQAEEQLREKEEQYRSIFEAVTDSLTISRLEDAQIIEANPAACKTLGYSYEEMIGLLPTATVPPDYLPVVAEGLQTLMRGGRNDLVMVALRKDGTPFPVEVHSTLFNYKGKPHLLTVSRDITERVQAEQQLREKEEQYRGIFEATYDAMFICDPDGWIVEVNPAFCSKFGYTYDELIGLHTSILATPESLTVLDEFLKRTKTGRDFQTVGLALRKDGTVFYADAHSTTFTYQGKPHSLGVIRDITEQVRAQEQLREKEAQYRGVFEATDDGLIINDLEGFCIEANPAYCRMLGYTREELIGLNYSQTTYPEYYPVLDESARAIQAGSQFQTQGLARRKDGSPLPVEARATPFIYKGKPHLLGVMRDITERVEAEKQLREREEQYRAIFEATSDGLTINDLEDGHVVEVNPAACQMYGYAYEEMIGLPLTATIHPDSFHHVTEALQATQAAGHYQARLVALRKDGTTFHVDGRGTPFIYKGKPHLLGVIRDITEQVEAEEQLREREEQYRGIFEASIDSLVIARLEDGQIVEANPATCTMFGYAYEELIGLSPAALVHPDYLQLVAESLQTFRTAGRSDPIQLVNLRKDGTPFPVEVHSSMFLYKGKPHLLAVTRDITERVEAERQLREREEQYRGVFEAATDAMFITALEGVVVEANPAACKMLGYSYEEIIGLSPAVLAHPDSLSQAAEDLQALHAGRDASSHMVLLRKDGTTLPTEGRATIFAHKGRPHVLAVLRDITERVEAEKQLREREEQYRSVFEATYDGLIILDLDGFYVEVNPAFCSMFGYTREELIGMHASVTTASETLPILDDALKTFKTGRGFQTVGQGLRKDGSVFYAESYGTTLTYRGKPHALGVIRDITEQVQAQQLLEQRVEERTRELSSLLEISHTVASTLQLKPLLGLILDQLKTVVDYTGSSILTVEGEELVFLDSRSPTPEEQLMQLRFPLKNLRLIWKTITSRESIIIQDVREDTPLARAFRVAMGQLGETTFHYVRACLFVPLTLREQVIGMLVLSSSEAQAFTPHHATLALAIANQAAIAIENARLYAQAQDLAAVEERQRLARELHDSVSQALYGISLGVHTARMQLERDPKELAESLDYVLELAEAALIEMRALIFELRPESLETEGLVTALSKQAAALQARQNIAVHTELCAEPALPLKVKQDLYRVAQEALHNTVKHARASKIELRLHQAGKALTLEVCDNGRGFDPTASFPGHLGLHSMQERVRSLGGELQIESAPGQGTCVRAEVPAVRMSDSN